MNKESFVVVSQARALTDRRERERDRALGCSRISQEELLLLLLHWQKALSFFVDRFVELRVGLFGLQNQRLRKGAVGRKEGRI